MKNIFQLRYRKLTRRNVIEHSEFRMGVTGETILEIICD